MPARRFLLGLAIALSISSFLASALPCLVPPTIQATVLSVTDGDTIRVRIEASEAAGISVGAEVPVRYIGVNTPEIHPVVERFGPEASELNTALVSGRRVFLELDAQMWEQREGWENRLLAYVYLDAQGNAMVNVILVAMGFAFATPYEPNVRYETLFQSLEDTARGRTLGVWSNCGCGPTTFQLGAIDARGESIEIRNVSSSDADLFGWVIDDGEGTYTFRSYSVIPAGGSYICRIDEYNPSKDTQGLMLGNDHDQVYLRCPSGDIVDKASW